MFALVVGCEQNSLHLPPAKRLGSVPPPAPMPTEKDVFGGYENDGEPMDLATPLQPTVLLDPEDL
jgi:hypothetical protein